MQGAAPVRTAGLLGSPGGRPAGIPVTGVWVSLSACWAGASVGGEMPTLQTLVDPLGMLPRAARAGRWAGMAFGDAASGVALAALDRALASRRADEAVDLVVSRLLSGGLPERVADDLLARGVVERVADRVLGGPEIHRLVASVLETDDVWILVREIVQSPEVTDAIGHQGAGLAGQVADEVGERTRRADARLERLARRVLRRPPRVDPIGPFAPPSAP